MTTHPTIPATSFHTSDDPLRSQSEGTPLPVALPATHTVRLLFVGVIAVVLMGIVSRVASGITTDFPGRDLVVPMFALGSEANIPTFYSSLLLGIAAALAWVIARAKRQVGDRFWRLWLTVSALFIYLSVDEVAQIHDRATMGVRKIVGDSAVLHYAWVLPYAFVVVAVIVLFVPFLRALPKRTAGGMILAGALYVLGGMGLEVIEGMLEFEGRFHSLAMPILVTTEEFLEMFSVVLFIGVLFDYLRRQLPNVHLDLSFTGDRTR